MPICSGKFFVFNTNIVPSAFTATGGDTVLVSGDYKIHIFSTVGTSTFNVTGSRECEYFIIAGGGSGGCGKIDGTAGEWGGGGGAGGIITGSMTISENKTIIVGDGGDAFREVATDVWGSPGENSSVGTITATGGGCGASALGLYNSEGTYAGQNGWNDTQNLGRGGSGGGKSQRGGTGVGGYGIVGQGKNGDVGLNSSTGYAGGGGGKDYDGSGGMGGSGIYLYWIPGVFKIVGGGGGGGAATTVKSGGSGGGGNGANRTSNIAATAGEANTGGGGGGGATNSSSTPDNAKGRNGGSGIVVIRYLIT